MYLHSSVNVFVHMRVYASEFVCVCVFTHVQAVWGKKATS